MTSCADFETVAQLVEAVRSTPRLLVVGARTKPRLSQVDPDTTLLSTRRLSGIIEYDPSEFTFTALAGTPVRDIAAALEERGQYLPFDPMLVDAGATLGGTVASGLSGPGRFRFGGIRDFILGLRFVDGTGRLLRMGGKVVKNAAGFDLPKFFVGSLGRFGVLAECTFKVFPRAASTLTLQFPASGIGDAARVLTEAGRTRWEPDALDILPDGQSVVLRLAGPESALVAMAREILAHRPGTQLPPSEAANIWRDIREFAWAFPNGALVKVATTATQLSALQAAVTCADGRLQVSAGGDVTYLSSLDGKGLAAIVRQLDLRGIMLRGDGPLWPGAHRHQQISDAVKHALDPHGRFPSIDA
jgi:glycolate oxidase FAD binding subunit